MADSNKKRSTAATASAKLAPAKRGKPAKRAAAKASSDSTTTKTPATTEGEHTPVVVIMYLNGDDSSEAPLFAHVPVSELSAETMAWAVANNHTIITETDDFTEAMERYEEADDEEDSDGDKVERDPNSDRSQYPWNDLLWAARKYNVHYVNDAHDSLIYHMERGEDAFAFDPKLHRVENTFTFFMPSQ